MSASAPSPEISATTLSECETALEVASKAYMAGGERELAIDLYETYADLVSSGSWPVPYVFCYAMTESALDSAYIAEPHVMPNETLGNSIGTGPGSEQAIASVESMWSTLYPRAQTQGNEVFEYKSGSGTTQYLGQFLSSGDPIVLCSCRMNNFYDRDTDVVMQNIDSAALNLLESGGSTSTVSALIALVAVLAAWM